MNMLRNNVHIMMQGNNTRLRQEIPGNRGGQFCMSAQIIAGGLLYKNLILFPGTSCLGRVFQFPTPPKILVPGKKYPETGVILESEFCIVQNPCLSKSYTKFGLQDHPCFQILLA